MIATAMFSFCIYKQTMCKTSTCIMDHVQIKHARQNYSIWVTEAYDGNYGEFIRFRVFHLANCTFWPKSFLFWASNLSNWHFYSYDHGVPWPSFKNPWGELNGLLLHHYAMSIHIHKKSFNKTLVNFLISGSFIKPKEDYYN